MPRISIIPRLLRVVGPRGNWRSSSDNIMLILGGEFGGDTYIQVISLGGCRYPNKNPLESFTIGITFRRSIYSCKR